jgi:EAL domain-containing protein (putative c-di-GMP-specific phosphodiesterase class I)
VIYQEALLRFAPESELAISPLVCILALERLGLIRQLDQWVVSSVIEKLAANPEIRLGCNISAQSAVADGWWAFIQAILKSSPDLAQRLIIEITETSQFSDIDAASKFVATLRSLKCRVALDDIGDGYSTIQILSRITPDVTKIDRTYLHAARFNKAGSDFLERLIALAKLCSGAVVVEGVETEEDLRIARRGGATWVQGYWLNKASFH